MSFLNQLMGRMTKGTSQTKCPVCGKSSQQSFAKVNREQTLLCPHCKSLFVVHP
ncbi:MULTISPECIES: YnfU family zinc-binding protein [Erwiniaceae]|uniref:YnfU family zinc-binding protein n=1 Tax=Erwinia TaxID=551 RepID=UPI001CD97D72|nr:MULTISPECIES: YnfU family zinc-binding protein [Erwinia]